MSLIEATNGALVKVSRVEVIDNTGRVYTNHGVKAIELSLQDGARTLKVFVNWGDTTQLTDISQEHSNAVGAREAIRHTAKG